MSEHTKHWCSGSTGSKCRHGHEHHGLACTPNSIAMAEEWLPSCLHDDGKPRRASGRPLRPEWLTKKE